MTDWIHWLLPSAGSQLVILYCTGPYYCSACHTSSQREYYWQGLCCINVIEWTSRCLTRLQRLWSNISLNNTQWSRISAKTQDWSSFLRLIWWLQNHIAFSWNGFLLKTSKIIPYNASIKFFQEILTNCRFFILLGDQVSRLCTLSDFLRQGSVLALILFNIYTSNLP